jgi:hypothetical protein
MVCQEAYHLLPSFRNKTTEAKKKVITQFTKSLGLTNHAATHTAQKNFMETEEESKHFIAMMKEKVLGIDPDHILNMDQTPIPFLYHSNKTLHTKVSNTIHVHASSTYTKCTTLAATVKGSGKMLPPMLRGN